MNTVVIYMTGNAWKSTAGKEIKRILDRCGFHNYMTEYSQTGDLLERTVTGLKQNPEWLRDLDRLFLGLDTTKGEFYEMLMLWEGGRGGWQRTTNRPKDLEPILDARATILYKGKSPDEFEKQYEDRR